MWDYNNTLRDIKNKLQPCSPAHTDTLSVAGEGCVAGGGERGADDEGRAHRHVGDPSPVGQRGLLQRAVDKETVVVADKGWGESHKTAELSEATSTCS